MKTLVRRVVACMAGVVTWMACFVVSNTGLAQTGSYVPAQVEVCRRIFWVLWFPFSWIPFPHTIGIGELLVILLIGVPYGVLAGFGISWLLRVRRPEKI